MNPHREKAPPCARCEARAEELAKMKPFDKIPFCPACGALSNERTGKPGPYRQYAIVCTGLWLIVKKGYWLFGRRGETGWQCEIKTPHFHMRCSSCQWRWLMQTALEQDDLDALDEDEDSGERKKEVS